MNTKGNESTVAEATPNSFQTTAPAITMPKGGGAIRGMGEKFAANPVTGTGSMTQLTAFFVTAKRYDETQARAWQDNATARHVYYFGEVEEKLPAGGTRTRWGQHPACVCGMLRERHVSQLAPGEQSPLQVGFEYSDGMGSVVVKKVQAETEKPGRPMRWIANGKTILNNKGKTVKQYEPYFSIDALGQPNHCYEEPKEEGVTPIMYYDSAGRLVRMETPDGSFSRVDFSPWHVCRYDPNDMAYDADPTKRSDWYNRRTVSTHPRFAEFNNAEDRRAATLVETHANTPATTFLDSLGRNGVSLAHNKFKDSQGTPHDEKYLTFTKLDAEGKPLWIRDAKKHLVMQYITPAKTNNDLSEIMSTGSVPCYDIAGNLLYQHSMDAGDRWMLMDAAGKPILAWGMNETPQGNAATRENRFYGTDYDPLHRPTAQWLKINNGPRVMVERYEYQDAVFGDVKQPQRSINSAL